MASERTRVVVMIGMIGVVVHAGLAMPPEQPTAVSQGAGPVLSFEPGQAGAAAGPTDVSGAGAAGDKPAFLDPDAPRVWTVEIEPSVWFVAASGKVRLPVTSGTGPGGFATEGDKVKLAAFDLDSARLRPAGAFSINADRWRFSFSGTDASLARHDLTASEAFRIGSVAVAPGDALDARFEFGTYEVTVGYQFWERDFQKESAHPESAVPIVLRLYALAGGRIYDVELDIRRTSGTLASANAKEFFAEPIAGVRAEGDFTKTFGIDVQVTGGALPLGNHTSYSFDVIAGFHWRPFENFGVQIGYRQLLYSLKDGEDLGEFAYDGRLAGLFFGAVLRF